MKIRHIQSRQELAVLADVLAKAYGGDYGQRIKLFERRIGNFPGLKLRDCRIVEADGEIVSHVRVAPKVMHVGRARLRVAGIGGVGTHPFHQGKGYSAALMHDTVRYMADEGYDASLLFGIPNFYPRFGFASVMATPRCSMALAALPKVKRGLALRPLRPADLPAVMELYRRYGMGCVGAMERTEAFWHYDKERWPRYRLVTERGAPLGFVEIGGGSSVTVDQAALPERTDAYDRVLAECGKLARERLCRTIELQLPGADSFVRYCQHLGADAHLSYRRDGGAMGRLVNLQTWARKMCPEWSVRLRESAFRSGRASATLDCELGWVTISADNGRVRLAERRGPRVVRTGQRVLAQLTFGYRSVESARLTGEIDASPGDAKLLAALFPERRAWVWPTDRF